MTGPCKEQFQKRDFPNREFSAPSLLLLQPVRLPADVEGQPAYHNRPFQREDLAKAGDYEFGLREPPRQAKAIYVKEAYGTVYWGGETQTLGRLHHDSGKSPSSRRSLARGRANPRALLQGRYFHVRTRRNKQAIVYHDLGNRFLCFFPQWKGGATRERTG